MFELITGSMASNKSKRIVEKAERLTIMERKYKVFYPNRCANGYESKVVSRSGCSIPAIPINEPLEIFAYVSENNLTDILIDEVQFLCCTEDQIDDLIMLIKYAERNNINLFIVGLDIAFNNEPFIVFEKICAYADKVVKLTAVCEICKNDKARKPLRTRNGKPCSFGEQLLIEKNNTEYKYQPVCNKCFYKAYEGLI